ncbi:MAG: DUF58 domain-containing protein [Proteobacteria bacterium]|nr:DUF58 domain-containing protein [Pseudomonadota bacterium]
MSNPRNNDSNNGEGITWISPQSLIQLRLQANKISLNKSIIHAKQGGAYMSSFKGRGMEFDESRIYQAGDDIRNMDWRVTARTGTAHTKVFREERERPVLLCLDLNASMMFATRNKFKSVIAAKLATLIAWSAAKNNDRIGGLIFSSDEHHEIKPRRGKTAVLDFIGRIAKHKSWHKALSAANNKLETSSSKRNMATAIARLHKVTHPGSLVFMISDFRNMDEKAYSHLANVARHNDIVLIKITDPIELDLPDSGSYKLTDGKNEVQIQTSSNKTRNKYHQRFTESNEQLEKFCRQNRIHLVHISTSDNALEKLCGSLGMNNNKRHKVRSATSL